MISRDPFAEDFWKKETILRCVEFKSRKLNKIDYDITWEQYLMRNEYEDESFVNCKFLNTPKKKRVNPFSSPTKSAKRRKRYKPKKINKSGQQNSFIFNETSASGDVPQFLEMKSSASTESNHLFDANPNQNSSTNLTELDDIQFSSCEDELNSISVTQ